MNEVQNSEDYIDDIHVRIHRIACVGKQDVQRSQELVLLLPIIGNLASATFSRTRDLLSIDIIVLLW